MARYENVIISSTARDLPNHRKEVMDACLSQGMFPRMMEHLPASDADAIGESLKMVDEADIYLGIFAHRYGYIPEGYDISITEMEYNRAVERGIPRLVFFMHEEHPLKAADVEIGESAVKLKLFKTRLEKDLVINYFKSSEDLRAHVINSLAQYRERELKDFHYSTDLPTLVADSDLINNYKTKLIEYVGKVRILGESSPRNLEKVFVELSIFEEYKRPLLHTEWLGLMDVELRRRRNIFSFDLVFDDSVSRKIKPNELLQKGTRSLIVGAPGCGKTSLLKYLALEIIQNDKYFPVFIELKTISQEEFASAKGKLVSLLVNKVITGLNDLNSIQRESLQRMLLSQLRKGELAIILDGLDEIRGVNYLKPVHKSDSDTPPC